MVDFKQVNVSWVIKLAYRKQFAGGRKKKNVQSITWIVFEPKWLISSGLNNNNQLLSKILFKTSNYFKSLDYMQEL